MTETIIYNGLPLEVTFDHHKAYHGARDSLGGVIGAGPPLEPDEPASIEITEIIYQGVNVTDLLENILDEIEEKVWDKLIVEPEYDLDEW